MIQSKNRGTASNFLFKQQAAIALQNNFRLEMNNESILLHQQYPMRILSIIQKLFKILEFRTYCRSNASLNGLFFGKK
jgi:hypothetical protein